MRLQNRTGRRPKPSDGMQMQRQNRLPGAAIMLGFLGGLAAAPAHAQSLAPAGGGWAPSTQAATPNSSVMPRSGTASTGQVALSLSAVLSEDGQTIDQGLAWYVFRAAPGADGRRQLAESSKLAAPQLKLEPGDYLVTATFGRATLTRRITVAAGQPAAEKFNLNAGGLRIKAVLANGEAAPDQTVVYDVLNEERDQAGNRVKVITAAKPGLIIRLNAGTYEVVSTYGDANARVRTEVSVEAGKLTEATLSQTGAKVTFKLVSRAGGEALADVAWSIINTKAETVKESAGALPMHILAAGRYAVLAKHDGKTFRVEFTAKAGDSTIVEVVTK